MRSTQLAGDSFPDGAMSHPLRRVRQPLLSLVTVLRYLFFVEQSVVIILDELFGGFRTFVKTNSNLRRHEHSNGPDMTKPTAPSGDQRHLRENAVDELSRLVIIVGYLWVIFEFLSFQGGIILSEYHLNYPEHAFGIVNSLVFGKVLLTRNCLWDIVLKLWRSVRAKPHPRPSETDLWAIDTRGRSLGIGLSSPD